MNLRIVAALVSFSLVACDSQNLPDSTASNGDLLSVENGAKPNSATMNNPGRVIARAAGNACDVTAATIVQAREEFERYCGVPATDCDPVDGQWLCSSQIFGANAADIPVACSATGGSLDEAKQHFSNACLVALRDCDPLDGQWLCSSEQIGIAAPTFAGLVSLAIPAEEVDFLKNLSLIEQWNELGLAAVRDGLARPTVTSHQLFLLSAAMYDAFATFDPIAEPYALASHRQLNHILHDNDLPEAVSQAAYQMLVRLFPDYEKRTGHFRQHMHFLGYRVLDSMTPVIAIESASAVGYSAAMAVLDKRGDDGSNFINDYADITSNFYQDKYKPVNKPGAIDQLDDFGQSFNPNRWQPLRIPNGTVVDGLSRPVVDELNLDSYGDQSFLTSHWGGVTPFALSTGSEFRPGAPPQYGSDKPYTDATGNQSTNHDAYMQQLREVIEHSATLNDKRKVIAEFWADGPRTESPPGHWNQLAHGLIGRDNLLLGDSVKLFFALNGALLDAGIATWEAKRFYDYIRPASAIRFVFGDILIDAWGGPNQGTQSILGQNWSPYQKLDFVTPPFPEYVSGHSTFSRASAEVLTLFSGSETFYDGETVTRQDVNGDGELDMFGEYIGKAGSFFIEEGPAEDVVIRWYTFKEAADEAGQSRLFGGIHIQDGDLRGRALGAAVGRRAFAKAESYFYGNASN